MTGRIRNNPWADIIIRFLEQRITLMPVRSATRHFLSPAPGVLENYVMPIRQLGHSHVYCMRYIRYAFEGLDAASSSLSRGWYVRTRLAVLFENRNPPCPMDGTTRMWNPDKMNRASDENGCISLYNKTNKCLSGLTF